MGLIVAAAALFLPPLRQGRCVLLPCSTGQIIPLLLGAGVISRDIYFTWARSRACMVDMQQQQEQQEQQRWRQRLYGRTEDEGLNLHGAKTSVV
jgi:hypothetical protein